jgi:uncharacterized protein (TIGR02246 family)
MTRPSPPPETPSSPDSSRPRPRLHQPERDATTRAVVEELIDGLQRGLDEGDADGYDAAFAADVLWGTPYGRTVAGFDVLNGIHRMMMTAPPAIPSRYEHVQSVRPAEDVIIAHVRRTLLDGPGGTAGSGNARGTDASAAFSEMAMYVLVRRGEHWWLTGGQNTPIRPAPIDSVQPRERNT